jgi:O-antigen/teichoic acid export membrane protein
MLKKALQNTFWTGTGAFFNLVLSIAFAGLTIRWLGLQDAGFALLVQAVTGMNSAVTSLGFYTAGVRYISEAEGRGDRDEGRRVVETMLACAFVLNVLVAGLVFFMAPLLARWSSYTGDMDLVRTYVGLTAAASVLQGISVSLKSPLEAMQRYDILTKRDMILGLGYGVLCLTLLRFFPSLVTLGVMQLAFAAASVAVFGTCFTRIFGYLPRPLINWAMTRKLWAFGRWSYVNGLGTMLIDNADRILVSGFFSAAALPLYSMGKRGFAIGHGLIAGQSVYLFPMFSSLTEDKREKAIAVEPKIRWFVTALSVGFYSAMILAGPPLLNLLVGNDFGYMAEPSSCSSRWRACWRRRASCHGRSHWPSTAGADDTLQIHLFDAGDGPAGPGRLQGLGHGSRGGGQPGHRPAPRVALRRPLEAAQADETPLTRFARPLLSPPACCRLWRWPGSSPSAATWARSSVSRWQPPCYSWFFHGYRASSALSASLHRGSPPFAGRVKWRWTACPSYGHPSGVSHES